MPRARHPRRSTRPPAPHPPFGHPLPASRGEGKRRRSFPSRSCRGPSSSPRPVSHRTIRSFRAPYRVFMPPSPRIAGRGKAEALVSFKNLPRPEWLPEAGVASHDSFFPRAVSRVHASLSPHRGERVPEGRVRGALPRLLTASDARIAPRGPCRIARFVLSARRIACSCLPLPASQGEGARRVGEGRSSASTLSPRCPSSSATPVSHRTIRSFRVPYRVFMPPSPRIAGRGKAEALVSFKKLPRPE